MKSIIQDIFMSFILSIFLLIIFGIIIYQNTTTISFRYMGF